MLGTHSLVPIIKLKRDDERIGALAFQDDDIFIGLKSGALRLYRIHHDAATPEVSQNEHLIETSATLIREDERFSSCEIRQLQVVDQSRLLVTLTDACVSILDLKTWAFPKILDGSQGAITFAAFTPPITPEKDTRDCAWKLAVACKGVVKVWIWPVTIAGSLDRPKMADIYLSHDDIHSLIWLNDVKLLAATTGGFILIDLKILILSNASTPDDDSHFQLHTTPVGEIQSESAVGRLFKLGRGMSLLSNPTKMLATLLSNKRVLLATASSSQLIDLSGDPIAQQPPQWSSGPKSLGFTMPYIVSLHGSGSKSWLEVRNVSTFSVLWTLPLPNSNCLCLPSLTHNVSPNFLMSSPDTVWMLYSRPLRSQLTDLLKQQEYDEALGLVESSENLNKNEKFRLEHEIKQQRGEALFRRHGFREALDLFFEGETDPHIVLSFYPRQAFDSILNPGSDQTPMLDDTFPRDGRDSPKVDGEAYDSETLMNDMIASLDINADIESSLFGEGEFTPPLDNKELEVAISELCAYLFNVHCQLSTQMLDLEDAMNPTALDDRTNRETPDLYYLHYPHGNISNTTLAKYARELNRLATIIDTALFCGYMRVRPSLVSHLFQVKNWCHPAVVIKYLYQSKLYDNLVHFLHGKKGYRQSLELLRRLGDGGGSVPYGYLGPRETISYLRRLKGENIDVLLEFILWPFEKTPEEAFIVFADLSPNAQTLPIDRVLNFLIERGPYWGIRYLEHLIEQQDNCDQSLHDRLIELYMLEISSENAETQQVWQAKLEHFLQTSMYYDISKALDKLPFDDTLYYQPRAIILDRNGLHTQALNVYVFDIQDLTKAESYCCELYDTAHVTDYSSQTTEQTPVLGHDDPRRIFESFLRMLLNPPPPQTPNFEAAMELIACYGSRIPGLSTLELVHPTIPLNSLQQYLTSRLRSDLAQLNILRLKSSLGRLGCDSSHAQLSLQEMGRKVNVDRTMLCRDCSRPFRNAFVRAGTSNIPVHYACSERIRLPVNGSPLNMTDKWF